MTVHHEIAEARRETGAWSPEATMHTRAVREGADGRARRLVAAADQRLQQKRS